jgi:hypothetical protein
MKRYAVTVHTAVASYRYHGISLTTWALYEAAMEKFGLCSVSVIPA